MTTEIKERINRLAAEGSPFLFVINYHGTEAYVKKLKDISPDECLYDFEGDTNVPAETASPQQAMPQWNVRHPSIKDYARSFKIVHDNIMAGNSYLTNLTCRVAVDTNLSLDDIFRQAKGKYKLLIKDRHTNNRFVCFSPEPFIRIKEGKIYSYPMKGTIEASQPNAEQILMDDDKEAAEHATIVDLIRNDLSQVATNITVEKYRYAEIVHTNKGNILQTSSTVSGLLPADWQLRLGEMLDAILPAGSITGAPKAKTTQIIHEAEGYDRDYYTGVMGIYANGTLNSAVMIRFIEQSANGMHFKAGGGITSMSNCQKEYDEVIQKVYLPL